MITFFVLGIAIYTLAQTYTLATKEAIIKHTKKCLYCRKDIGESVRQFYFNSIRTFTDIIPMQAQRCAFCTSWLDGREDRETSGLAR